MFPNSLPIEREWKKNQSDFCLPLRLVQTQKACECQQERPKKVFVQSRNSVLFKMGLRVLCVPSPQLPHVPHMPPMPSQIGDPVGLFPLDALVQLPVQGSKPILQGACREGIPQEFTTGSGGGGVGGWGLGCSGTSLLGCLACN